MLPSPKQFPLPSPSRSLPQVSPVPGAAAPFHVPRPGLAVSRACKLWGERWVSGSGQPGGDFGGEGALVALRGE